MGIKQFILDWFGYRILTDEEYSDLRRDVAVKTSDALRWKTIATQLVDQLADNIQIERSLTQAVQAVEDAVLMDMSLEERMAAADAALAKNCERLPGYGK